MLQFIQIKCEKWYDYPKFLALKTNSRNLVREISAAKVLLVFAPCGGTEVVLNYLFSKKLRNSEAICSLNGDILFAKSSISLIDCCLSGLPLSSSLFNYTIILLIGSFSLPEIYAIKAAKLL